MSEEQAWNADNDQEIERRIQKEWSRTIVYVNTILKAHLKYGFHEIQENIHPSIDDIQISLKVIESVFKALHEAGVLGLDEERMVLNILQCIWYISMLAKALDGKDVERYNEAINWLNRQSK